MDAELATWEGHSLRDHWHLPAKGFFDDVVIQINIISEIDYGRLGKCKLFLQMDGLAMVDRRRNRLV